MQNRFILRNLTIFFIVTLFAVTYQDSKNLKKNNLINPEKEDTKHYASVLRPKRAGKPGFFRTLFSVVYEQYADTKNTFNKVNELVNDNFLPENPPSTSTTESSDPNATTTEAPYKITRNEFNRIIRRNLRGLVRLFNIELAEANKQSVKNRAEFRRNATIEVSKFL